MSSYRAYIVVVLSAVVIYLGTVVPWASFAKHLTGAILAGAVVEETNLERVRIGAAALTHNPLLDQAATRKARDMATHGYFAHVSPTGVTPWYWFKESGYTYRRAGENLAVHFEDSSVLVDAWMNSPTHRANIVNDKFTEIGIGVATGTFEGKRTTFTVQLFGTPDTGIAGKKPNKLGASVADTMEYAVVHDTANASADDLAYIEIEPVNQESPNTGMVVMLIVAYITIAWLSVRELLLPKPHLLVTHPIIRSVLVVATLLGATVGLLNVL